jgi:hypothetical protein
LHLFDLAIVGRDVQLTDLLAALELSQELLVPVHFGLGRSREREPFTRARYVDVPCRDSELA